MISVYNKDKKHVWEFPYRVLKQFTWTLDPFGSHDPRDVLTLSLNLLLFYPIGTVNSSECRYANKAVSFEKYIAEIRAHRVNRWKHA
jgi:hypothetical protein